MSETVTFSVDEDALRATLEALVAKEGSQVAAAKALGIKSTYLHDMLHGRRDIGALAARLGYRTLRVFVVDGEPMVTAAEAARLIDGLRRRRMSEVRP